MNRPCVILLLLCCLISVAGAQSHKPKKPQKTPAQLHSALNSIQQRKAAIKRELAKTRRETHAVQVDIRELDQNLEKLEDDLDETQTSLDQSIEEQSQLSSQLKAATERVAVVREQVRRRLRYMYMHRGESVLTAFISAKSVGEIASRKMVLEAIANKDRSLFNEFRDLQSRIKDRKRRQDIVVVRVAGLKERQLDQQAHLEVTKDQKKDALKDLKSKQDQLKALLAQMEADEAEVFAQIRAYQAAQRRNPPKPGDKKPPVFVGRFLKPANGPITSQFGMRMHPILHYRRLHAGLDIGAPSGSPISAAGDGIVIVSQYSRSYGNMVVIDHGNGLSTLYAHASRVFVRAGQTVKRGQKIAAVGSTGLAQGPHLHWEVRVNGSPVNPLGRF